MLLRKAKHLADMIGYRRLIEFRRWQETCLALFDREDLRRVWSIRSRNLTCERVSGCGNIRIGIA